MDMIHIKTFLRDLEEKFFWPGPNPSPRLGGGHPVELQGAIDMRINEIQILDRDTWDCIDELWAYLTSMAIDLKQHGYSRTYFPDQPIEVTFARVGRMDVKVVCNVGRGDLRSAVVPELELISSLKAAGIEFFTAMGQYTTNAYHAELADLSKL
ncbi:hypothetical protein ACTWPB_02815 [Nocardia sp. IBHARD005]|uniref:hypothetical protein n=1 Tax=Nocardia sp. IBHARD005 TaxID=3457765 RepID=UPI00405928A5